MSAPGKWPIALTEGDPFSRTLIVRVNGTPLSFSPGTVGSAAIRRHYGDGAAVIATMSVDCSNASSGEFTVTLDAAGIAAVDAIDFAAEYGAQNGQAEIDLGEWALAITDGNDPEKRRTWLAGPVTYHRTAL
jgi:hypothetical protein